MKTFSFIFLLLAFFSFEISAQNARESRYPFPKLGNVNGVNITIQGKVNNVEDVLTSKFRSATGEKGKNYKGLRAYEGVRFASISPNTLDLYFNVEKPSKKDEINSAITLFLSTGNYNFIDSNTYPDEIKAVKRMLNGLEKEVKIYELNLAITEQTKVVEKNINMHTKMVDDSIRLEEERIAILQEIEQNKIDRANQLGLIAEEEARLGAFRLELNRTEGGEINEDGKLKEEDEE